MVYYSRVFEKFTQNWAHFTHLLPVPWILPVPGSGWIQSRSDGANTRVHLVDDQGLCSHTPSAGSHLDASYLVRTHCYTILEKQQEFHQLYLILFCQQQNPGHSLHCLEDGSAFLNLAFGVVSRSYPLFYLTVKSIQNVGFSVYPVISSKDWTLYLCLPSAKDNFLSHFHCFKQHNCSTSKKEIVQTDFVNKWATRAQPSKTLENILLATLLLWNGHLKENRKTSWKLKGRGKNKNNLVAVWNLSTPTLCLQEGQVTTPQQHNRTGKGKEKSRCGDQESGTLRETKVAGALPPAGEEAEKIWSRLMKS